MPYYKFYLFLQYAHTSFVWDLREMFLLEYFQQYFIRGSFSEQSEKGCKKVEGRGKRETISLFKEGRKGKKLERCLFSCKFIDWFFEYLFKNEYNFFRRREDDASTLPLLFSYFPSQTIPFTRLIYATFLWSERWTSCPSFKSPDEWFYIFSKFFNSINEPNNYINIKKGYAGYFYLWA